MLRQVNNLLEEPTAANYLAAQAALRKEYPAVVGAELWQVGDLCRRRQFADARALLEAMSEGWTLSLAYHGLATRAATELGDLEDAEVEWFLRECCCRGLEATGEGSKSQPFYPTYVSDGREMLLSRGDQIRGQRQCELDGRRYDVYLCDRGEYWFDLSHVVDLRRLGRVATARSKLVN